jgi:hypothetical protein
VVLAGHAIRAHPALSLLVIAIIGAGIALAVIFLGWQPTRLLTASTTGILDGMTAPPPPASRSHPDPASADSSASDQDGLPPTGTEPASPRQPADPASLQDPAALFADPALYIRISERSAPPFRYQPPTASADKNTGSDGDGGDLPGEPGAHPVKQ